MTRDYLSQPMFVSAIIEPKRMVEDGVEKVDEGFMTLTLKTGDGPETWAHFDATTEITAEDSSRDGDGGYTLVEAIQLAVNNMIDAAFEIESYEWESAHKEVFLVVGHTGEHSDAKTWTVRGFLNESYAEELRNELNDVMVEAGMSEPTPEVGAYRKAMEVARDLVHKDPGFSYDHCTGTTYTVEKAPLDSRNVYHDHLSGD